MIKLKDSTIDLNTKLSNKVLEDLKIGIPLSELEKYIENLMATNLSQVPFLISSMKKSSAALEGKFENVIIKITSSSLLSCIGLLSTEETIEKLNFFHLHTNAILIKEKNTFKIFNPYSLSSLTFNCSVEAFKEIFLSSLDLQVLMMNFQLCSDKPHENEISTDFIEDLFLSIANEETGPLLDYKKYHEILNRLQKKQAPFSSELMEIDKLDFNRAMLERSSLRTPSKNLEYETLKQLLQFVFSELPDKRRLYPAAGAMYEIFPIVQIYSKNFNGLKAGVYHYNQTDGFFSLITEKTSNHVRQQDFFPQVSISLVSELEMAKEKYGALALKLSLLNSGILLAYLSIFATALKLNTCAFGKNCLPDGVLNHKQKELSVLCLF